MLNPGDPRLQTLHSAMRRHPPRRAEPRPPLRPASVALIVRPAPATLELLLIRRAERAGDPWSGHMAFPGGRRDATDADALAAAIRETREEVGIDLRRRGRLLGGLDDVEPRAGAPPVLVSPFVFATPASVQARPNPEVQEAFWVPLPLLASPAARCDYLYCPPAGEPLRFPALAYGADVIWGLTYRILQQFLERAGLEAPA